MTSRETPTVTPMAIIAEVSRIVTQAVDRVTGDRVDYPLLVAQACVEALKMRGIESRVMYGQVAWIEITEDHNPVWAGCWGENFHFWVATEYGEVVDLNTSVAYRKRSHAQPQLTAKGSAPMLWSKEVPAFYRYIPEGIAEVDLSDLNDPRDRSKLERVREILNAALIGTPPPTEADALAFPNEPIVCPGRQILDDSRESFKHFDRVLSVRGLPQPPI